MEKIALAWHWQPLHKCDYRGQGGRQVQWNLKGRIARSSLAILAQQSRTNVTKTHVADVGDTCVVSLFSRKISSQKTLHYFGRHRQFDTNYSQSSWPREP